MQKGNHIREIKSILVVDDNEINTELLITYLHRIGYRADAALSGAAALRLCSKKQYDLVFMDLRMPDMDGFETTHGIFEQYSPADKPAVVAITANATSENNQHCYQAGMLDCIEKPVNFQILRQIIDDIRIGKLKPFAPDTKSRFDKEIIDKERLREVADVSGDDAADFIEELIEAFAEQALCIIEDIIEEQERLDPQHHGLQLHTLKGISKNLGAVKLAELSQEIENRLKDGGDLAPEDLPELESCFSDSLHELRDYLSTL